MVTSFGAGYDILILILLVAPGYLGVKLFISITGIHDTLSRLENIVSSLFVSLFSGILVYVLLSAVFSWPNLGALLYFSGYVTLAQLQDIPLAGYIWIYMFHVLLSLGASSGAAIVIGLILTREIQPPMPYEKAWELDSGDRIRIITRSGGEIFGRKLAFGDYERGRGLLVLSPERVYRESGLEVHRVRDGQHLYVHEDAVSQIEFFEPDEFDPDRERAEEVGEDEDASDNNEEEPDVQGSDAE